MRSNSGLIAGLIAGIAVLVLATAGSYQNLDQYSGGEIGNRTYMGYPCGDFAQTGSPFTVASDSASTDSTGLWWPTRGAFGTGARVGKVFRFTSFKVCQWMWSWSAASNYLGPCSLFVFSGGAAGVVDSGVVASCSDTLVVPAPHAGGATSVIQTKDSPWYHTRIDSILVVPADSCKYFGIVVEGDSF